VKARGFDRRIMRVFYSRSTDRVRIIFDDRTIYVVPRRLMEGLESAATQELKRIEIVEGPKLHWPLLVVTHEVARLLEGVYGGRRWMANLERVPTESSPRRGLREAEKAGSARARRFLGDGFVVMTNARANAEARTPKQK
jgi:hypothetical protein